jgi:co-chaperonin GroES (HSP10)
MIQVLGFRVLVKPDQGIFEGDNKERGVRKLKSGILITDSLEVQREEVGQVMGTVVDVGVLAWSDKGDGQKQVKVGDYVAFAKYGGTPIRDPEDGTLYIILNDLDITARVSKPESESDE